MHLNGTRNHYSPLVFSLTLNLRHDQVSSFTLRHILASSAHNRSASTLPSQGVHLIFPLSGLLLLELVFSHGFSLVTCMTLDTAVTSPQPAWVSISVCRSQFRTTPAVDVACKTSPSGLSIEVDWRGRIHATHFSVLVNGTLRGYL